MGFRKSAATKYYKINRPTDGFTDAQFLKPPPRIPYKAITLAILLFLAGSLLLIIGSLLITGYIDVKYADRTWPVIILGTIMFIPGAYHVRIAYCAFQGYRGYSYEDIPEFE